MFKYLLACLCLYIYSTGNLFGQKKNADAVIRLHVKHGSNVDSIITGVWRQNIFTPVSASDVRRNQDFQVETIISKKDADGYFIVPIQDIDHPVYITLAIGQTPTGKLRQMFAGYIVEAGYNINIALDSVVFAPKYNSQMKFDDVDVSVVNPMFSGQGATTFLCAYSLQQEMEKFLNFRRKTGADFVNPENNSGLPDSVFWTGIALKYMDMYESKGRFLDSVLSTFKAQLSKTSFLLLKADIQTNIGQRITSMLLALPGDLSFKTDSSSRNVIMRNVKLNYLNKSVDYGRGIPKEILQFSYWFPYYEVRRLCYSFGWPQALSIIEQNYSGLLRDKLVTCYVKDMTLSSRSFDERQMNHLISLVRTPQFATYVDKLLKNRLIGRPATDFSLTDSAGKIWSLRDFSGKTLFLDFWFTGCGPCQDYYTNVVSKAESYFVADTSVIFISVSIDLRKETWIKSVFMKSGYGYTSPNEPNVVNLYTNELANSHPIIRAYNITAYPTPMLIDKNGNLFAFNTGRILDTLDGLINQINKAKGIEPNSR